MIVPLVTPEDLVVMKAIAHRPRDLADIEAVVSLHPRLDRVRIFRLVREFAAVLKAPELVRDLERILPARRPRPVHRAGKPRRRR